MEGNIVLLALGAAGAILVMLLLAVLDELRVHRLLPLWRRWRYRGIVDGAAQPASLGWRIGRRRRGRLMRRLVRVATALLCAALAGFSVMLEDRGFAFAAAAVLGLEEMALALRARRASRAGRVRPSSFDAARISYSEQDGVVALTLSGAEEKRSVPACVVLSRNVRSRADTTAQAGGPRLELSPPRRAMDSVIEGAWLSPGLLRLALDARAAASLGAETICVRLPQGADQRGLERALGRILRGIPFTSERSVPEEEGGMSTAEGGWTI